VLLVGMMFASILAVSLVSYINLSRTSMQLSQRALWASAAMNLAENGLEEAMYSLNRRVSDPSYSWRNAGWGTDDDEAWRKWTNLPVDGAARGEIRVYVYNYTGESSPVVVARGIVRPPTDSGSPNVEKWVLIRTRRATKFANGLVAREFIRFNGANATVDSWISQPDSGGSFAYSSTRARDQASVGSVSVAVDSVAVQNARIWGYASTGGALPQVGPQGSIGPFGSANGFIDMNRVSTHFFANFELGFNSRTVNSFAAPVAESDLGKLAASSDPNKKVQPPALVKLSTGKFKVTPLVLNSTILEISGPVELFINATPAPDKFGLDIGGTGAIRILPTGVLTIYTLCNVKIAGTGVVNGGTTGTTAGLPSRFQLYGQTPTATVKQTITIAGDGALSGAIYAPGASVTIAGNRDVLGSIVANDITFAGSVLFHQDESLAKLTTAAPYRLTSWNELTTESERKEYRDDLDDI
jgi:hypothetical protein